MLNNVYLFDYDLRAVLVLVAEHVAAEDRLGIVEPKYFKANLFSSWERFKLQLIQFHIVPFVRHLFLVIG